METKKFNNKEEFNKWYHTYIEDEPVVFEDGETPEPPTEYPCIMAYHFDEYPFFNTEDYIDEIEELENDGCDHDEITKLSYEYIYPSHFE